MQQVVDGTVDSWLTIFQWVGYFVRTCHTAGRHRDWLTTFWLVTRLIRTQTIRTQLLVCELDISTPPFLALHF